MTQKTKYEAIVIGASWGGLTAITKVMEDIPESFPIPIVLVLHRLKDFSSELDIILQRKINIKVFEIDEKQPLEPGCLYIAPADYHVLIEQDRTFSLCVSEPENYSRPSIDVTFESAAQIFGKNLVGIILTGANKDGSKGLKAIAEAGGLAIVQDPKEAEVNTMPIAAIELIENPLVLTLTQIKGFLLSLI